MYSISACEDELKLEPGGGVFQINLDEYKENEQWTIVNTSVVNGTRLCASNLKFCFHLRRKPAFFVMNIVLPIMILSIMTLTVFWLPPDSGEKTELAITIVLAFTVFQLLVSEIIPRTSDTTPLLGDYIYMPEFRNECPVFTGKNKQAHTLSFTRTACE